MTQTLRPYQIEAVDAVTRSWEQYKRVLIACPTGTGKSTILAEIVDQEVKAGRKVLALAHRKELLEQMYERFAAHCGLDEYEIGIEQAHNRAPVTAKVVIGSMLTVVGKHRLIGWQPDLIIIDEAHRGACASYKSIVTRFTSPSVRLLGCTATPKRADRSSLYAINPSGTTVMLEHAKTGKRFPASPDSSVFERLVYELPLFDAIDDGWIVDMVAVTVKTATNLDKVDTDSNGEFVQSQLQKEIDNEIRTNAAISAWKKEASNRQTIVFCAGIGHSNHAAAAWRDAGYNAVSITSETPEDARYEAYQAFRNGQIQVLCNMAVYTEGADVPECACGVMLRPVKSWGLFMQMIGRVLRPLPGVVDFEGSTDESRKVAIALSQKPDACIIDVVDVTSKHDVCSVPKVLDVPIKADGHKLTEVKKDVERLMQCGADVIVPENVTYNEVEVILERRALVRASKAQTKAKWRAMVEGFRLSDTIPGYEATLLPADNPFPLDDGLDWYTLSIRHASDAPFFHERCSMPVGLDHALDHAAQSAHARIQAEHQRRIDDKEKGTVRRLQKMGTGGLYRALRARKHKDEEIERMPFEQAKQMAIRYVNEYHARRQTIEAPDLL